VIFQALGENLRSDIVEASFYIKKEGGDFLSCGLEGFHFVNEGKSGVIDTSTREGTSLIWVNEFINDGVVV
jgi:hypothetical protein